MALSRVSPLVLAGMIFATPVFPQSATALLEVTNAPVLTNAAQILHLTPEEAKANPPVRIHGIVTCYDPGKVLFVQDSTAGVFVYYSGGRLSLEPGQHVQVTGFAGAGLYSPIIVSPSIQPQESDTVVNPRPVSMAQVDYGGLDAQWVEVSGVIRVLDIVDGQLTLKLADPPHRILVWITDGSGYESLPLVGSLVKIRCVVGSFFDARDQLEGFQAYANGVSDITILRKPLGDSFSAPQCLIRDLKTYIARNGAQDLVRIQGVVTLCKSRRVFFIQDSTGGLEVRTQTPIDNLSPGTMVEVAGYPGPVLESPLLEDALIRKLDAKTDPQPTVASPGELFQGIYENCLVELKAFYLGRANVLSNTVALAVQAGDHHLTALLDTRQLPRTLTDLKPGSLLRLTGVCRFERNPGSEATTSLLLRSPADIKIISTPASTSMGTLLVLATTGTVAGVGLAAALLFIQRQRRRTEAVLQLHATLEAEMRESEQQLRRSVEERERIGRDLHDDIIQSIYAAGLSLEDCKRVVRQSPEQAESRLAAAIHTLNDTIHGVRGFIAGLEPKVLNGHEFKTALKSLAITSADTPTPFQFQVDPAAANSLTSTQATQLLHIAKEAMSNSLRHAHASGVTVSLQPVSNGIRLEIADDGVGFNPGAVSNGQGLRNMAARAREIGGNMQTISAPGQGCRILVTVLQQNAHEHD